MLTWSHPIMTDWGHYCWTIVLAGPGNTPPSCAACAGAVVTDLALWENWQLFGDFHAPFLKWSCFLGDPGVIWSNFVHFLLLGAELRQNFLEIFHGDIWYLPKQNKRVSIAVKFIKQNLSGIQKVSKWPDKRVKWVNSPRAIQWSKWAGEKILRKT